MDRKDAARAAQRREHEIWEVVNVHRATEPVCGNRQLGAMPEDAEPALAELHFVVREVSCPRELRYRPPIRTRIHEPVVVDVVDLGQGQDLVADEPSNPRPLVDRGGVIDRDAHARDYFRLLSGYRTSPTAIRLQYEIPRSSSAMLAAACSSTPGASPAFAASNKTPTIAPSAKPNPAGVSGNVVMSAEASATKTITLGAMPASPSAIVTRNRRATSHVHATPVSPISIGMPPRNEFSVPCSNRAYCSCSRSGSRRSMSGRSRRIVVRPITTSTTSARPTCIVTRTSPGTAPPKDRPVAASINRNRTTTSMMRSARIVPIVVEKETLTLIFNRYPR